MGDSLDDTDPVVQLKSKEVYLDIKSLEIRENHGFVSKRRGIRNLGNSCFLSAAIQCFVSTPGIVDNLLPNLGTFICEHNTPTGESSDMQKESNGASEGQEENKDGTESSGAENETSSKDENHETQDIGIPSQKQNQREDKPEPGQGHQSDLHPNLERLALRREGRGATAWEDSEALTFRQAAREEQGPSHWQW